MLNRLSVSHDLKSGSSVNLRYTSVLSKSIALTTLSNTKNNRHPLPERALKYGRNWTRTSDPYDVKV
ncbi:hypothetical protein [Microcoleus sp. N9_A1]|uniref:hypothetical protein n=1 Tax=Microcoleus sp. N9_A1 TaxID=3055380 RepID=UPI002FD351B8